MTNTTLIHSGGHQGHARRDAGQARVGQAGLRERRLAAGWVVSGDGE